jgi:hypothetical protein
MEGVALNLNTLVTVVHTDLIHAPVDIPSDTHKAGGSWWDSNTGHSNSKHLIYWLKYPGSLLRVYETRLIQQIPSWEANSCTAHQANFHISWDVFTTPLALRRRNLSTHSNPIQIVAGEMTNASHSYLPAFLLRPNISLTIARSTSSWRRRRDGLQWNYLHGGYRFFWVDL